MDKVPKCISWHLTVEAAGGVKIPGMQRRIWRLKLKENDVEWVHLSSVNTLNEHTLWILYKQILFTT